MAKLTTLILSLAIILTACNVATQTSNSPSDTTIVLDTALPPTPTPLNMPTNIEGNLVTDSRVGFTFVYPEDWYNTGGGAPSPEALVYSYVVQSIAPGVGGGGFPDGESKVDIGVRVDETYDSLETVLERIRREASTQEGTRIGSTEYFTLDSGIEALLIRGESMFGEFESIHLLIKGHHVSLSNIGEERFMFQIANSIRPS